MGKTNSLNENDLAEFIKLSGKQHLNDNSWIVNIDKIKKETWNLAVNNPNRVEEIDNRTPKEIINEIEKLDEQTSTTIQKIKELL